MRAYLRPEDRRYGGPPGTAFEDLPDDWLCPVCLAEKSRFSPFVSPLGRLGL